MSMRSGLIAAIFAIGAAGSPAVADVITDWNEKAVTLVGKHRMLPPQAERVIACVHLAMFDAVNSIEPRYKSYRVSLPAQKTTPKDAAAAVAAGTVLAKMFPQDEGEINAAVGAYLAVILDGAGKSVAVELGRAVGAKMIADREGDGADASDAYRPRTTAGMYVPTPITASSMWPKVRSFAMSSPSQFRPQPPVSLNEPAMGNGL